MYPVNPSNLNDGENPFDALGEALVASTRFAAERQAAFQEKLEAIEAMLGQCRAKASNLADQVAELEEKLAGKDKEIERLKGLLAQTDDEEERFSRW